MLAFYLAKSMQYDEFNYEISELSLTGPQLKLVKIGTHAVHNAGDITVLLADVIVTGLLSLDLRADKGNREVKDRVTWEISDKMSRCTRRTTLVSETILRFSV